MTSVPFKGHLALDLKLIDLLSFFRSDATSDGSITTEQKLATPDSSTINFHSHTDALRVCSPNSIPARAADIRLHDTSDKIEPAPVSNH